jgi:hypothetical protein
VKVVVELLNYPEITPFIKKEVTFVVTITAVCQTTTFVRPTVPNLLYQIGTPPTFVKF